MLFLIVGGLAVAVIAFMATSLLRSSSRAENSLTWGQLRNATYPSELTKSKQAPLADGLYEEASAPGSASRVSIKLADLVGFGELDSGRTIDAVVVLIESGGGSGTFIYLSAVLNKGGEAKPAAVTLLGDRVAVRSLKVEAGSITVGMRVRGSSDPLALLTTEVTRTYVLEGGQLVQKNENARDVPSEPPNQFAFQPERLTIDAGKQVARERTLAPGELATYLLAAGTGQQLRVSVSSQFNNAILSIQGVGDLVQLVSRSAYATTWSGSLPSTQDYAVTVINLAGSDLKFSLILELRQAATKPASVTPRPRVLLTATRTPSTGIVPSPLKGPVRPTQQPLANLDGAASTYINTRSPVIGTALFDPATNVLYSQNGDAQLELASAVKVLIALAVMDAAQQDSRYVDRFELSLLWPMITLSDNDAANALWDELGGGAGLSRYLASAGIGGVRPYNGEFWGTSTASANSLALILARAAFGDLLNAQHRDLFLQLLEGVTSSQRWGVPAGAEGETGTGDLVGLKNGWYQADAGWRVNSVGFVVSRSSSAYYTVAVLANEQPAWDYGIDTIQTVAEQLHSRLIPDAPKR